MVNENKLGSTSEKWKIRTMKTTAAALGVLAIAGCSKAIEGSATPDQPTAVASSESTISVPNTNERQPDLGSIFEGMPPEVDKQSWCGYKASQVAIHWLLDQAGGDGSKVGTFKTKDNQNYFVVTKTSIGFSFSNMELHPAEDLVVRGDLSVMSKATDPIEALDTASFLDDHDGTSGIRLSVAVYDLSYSENDAHRGGTTDGAGDICEAAQKVVNATH